MNFNGIKEVAPFVEVIGGDAVARNGAGDAIHGTALFVQRQVDRRGAGARRWQLLVTAEAFEVFFYGAALFIGLKSLGLIVI